VTVLDQLEEWASGRPQHRKSVDFSEVHGHYVKRAAGYVNLKRTAIASAALGTAGFVLNQMSNETISTDALDGRLREAFQLQYPNLAADNALDGLTVEQVIERYGNGLRGKYFEVYVRDELNSGNSIGGLRLESGQSATLAASPTQEGWDLLIAPEGSLYQIKATDSVAYLKSTLNDLEGKDIAVITTNLDAEIDALSDGLFMAAVDSAVLDDEIASELLNAADADGMLDEVGDFFFLLSLLLGLRLAWEAYKRYRQGVPLQQIALELGPSIAGRVIGGLSPIPGSGTATKLGLDFGLVAHRRRKALKRASARLAALIERMTLANVPMGLMMTQQKT